MRLVRISSIPDKYQKLLQPEFQQSAGSSYATIWKQYFDHYIAMADVMTYELNKRGSYDAIEIVLNHEILQKQWAAEHGISYSDKWQDEILRAQIRHYNADIIFVNTSYISSGYLDEIAQGTNLRLKIIWDGYQYTNPSTNKGFDLVLTCIESIKEKYDAVGIDCKVLPFAFDSRVLERISCEKLNQVSFVGSLSNGHGVRRAGLVYLLKRDVNVKLYIDNIAVGHKLLSRPMLREIIQRKDRRGFYEVYFLQKHNLGVRFGIAMYEELAESSVTLNFHGKDVVEAGNMRLFEATGLGTCLLTDNKPGLDRFFQPDHEVVTFSTNEELLEKALFLTRNPAKAQEIGQNARKRVFEQHLWSHRVEQLDQLIKSKIR